MGTPLCLQAGDVDVAGVALPPKEGVVVRLRRH